MSIVRAQEAICCRDHYASLFSILVLLSLLVNAALSAFPVVETQRETSFNGNDAATQGELTTGDRQIIVADTYLVVDSPKRAYHKDPYYVYGTLFERGANLDIGAPNCPIHIYWGDGPHGEEFITSTSDMYGFEGHWRIPITVNHTEGEYPLFIEFRGQVFVNGSLHEYDSANPHHHKQDGSPKNMTRYPSNVSIDDVQVFYHSFVDADISTTNLEIGELFWLNGSVTVNETGATLGGVFLNVTLDDNTIDMITTREDGTFEKVCRLANSTHPGGHTIRIEYWQFAFEENEEYGSSYSYFGIHFQQLPVMYFTHTSLRAGEMAYVNGTITDLRGESLYDPLNPDKEYRVQGSIINDTIGETFDLGSQVANNGTNFSFSFRIPKDFPPSTAHVDITFSEDILFLAAKSRREALVVTEPTVSVDNVIFDEFRENITGRIVDGGDRGLSVDLMILLDGMEMGQARSDGNGDFRVEIELPESIDIGQANIMVTAPETVFSLEASGSAAANVLQSAIRLPDLFIDMDSLSFEYRMPGDGSGELNVTFSVSNIGNIPSEATSILFRSLPGLDESIFLEGIESGSELEIQYEWKVLHNRSIEIVVNPDEGMPEIDMDNNELFYDIGRKYFDIDGDGIHNFEDDDTDGDEYTDEVEVDSGSDPYDRRSRPEPGPFPPDDDTDVDDDDDGDEDRGSSQGYLPLILIALSLVVIVVFVVIIRRKRD